MKIYANRCRGFEHPEHSVQAIREALLSNVDGISITVFYTKDKRWVAINKPFRDDKHKQRERVQEKTYAQVKREVLDLDAILALHAALGGNKTLFLDVRCVGETRGLVRLIRRHNLQDQVIITAWEPEVLRRVHKEAPGMKLGLSYVPVHRRLRRFKDTKPLKKKYVLFELPDLPLFSIQVNALICSSSVVKDAHERNVKVYAIKVNNKLTRRVMKGRNVDGIITDWPRAFVAAS